MRRFAGIDLGREPVPDADVMKRIAAPMLGGVTSALIMVLIVFPAIFYIWRSRGTGS